MEMSLLSDEQNTKGSLLTGLPESSVELHTLSGLPLCVLVTQSCSTLCDSMDCSPWGSSVHGILQARIMEWVAISFSRGSPWPRDWIQVSGIASRFFTV